MTTTNSPLARFAYVSVASDMLTDLGMLQVLQQSWRNNNEHLIRGHLDYAEGMFRQVIEGPPKAISALAAAIMVDPRHHQLDVIEFSISDEAHFTDWSVSGFEAIAEKIAAIPRLEYPDRNVIVTEFFRRRA